jgi:hypothetical protein
MITEDILDSQCITNEDNYGRVAIEAREAGSFSTQTIEWKVSLDSWPHNVERGYLQRLVF